MSPDYCIPPTTMSLDYSVPRATMSLDYRTPPSAMSPYRTTSSSTCTKETTKKARIGCFACFRPYLRAIRSILLPGRPSSPVHDRPLFYIPTESSSSIPAVLPASLSPIPLDRPSPSIHSEPSFGGWFDAFLSDDSSADSSKSFVSCAETMEDLNDGTFTVYEEDKPSESVVVSRLQSAPSLTPSYSSDPFNPLIAEPCS